MAAKAVHSVNKKNEVACGIALNEKAIIITDDPKAVTCVKCNGSMGTRKNTGGGRK